MSDEDKGSALTPGEKAMMAARRAQEQNRRLARGSAGAPPPVSVLPPSSSLTDRPDRPPQQGPRISGLDADPSAGQRQPRLPRIGGLEELPPDPESTRTPEGDNSRASSPGGALGQAAFNTFIAPSIARAKFRAKQFAPNQFAFNVLSQSGIGQKILEFKGNYNYARNPDGADGYGGDASGSNGPPPADNASIVRAQNGSAGASMGASMSSLGDRLSAGLTSIVTEIQRLRASVTTYTKNGPERDKHTKTILQNTADTVTAIKGLGRKDKGADKVAAIGQDDMLGDKAPEVEKRKTSLMMRILNGIGSFITGILGAFKKAGVMIKGALRSGVSGIAKVFSSMGKALKAIKVGSIVSAITKFTKMAGGILKAVAPLAKIVGRFSGILTIIMAAVDGIVGAFKGFSNTEGSLNRKIMGAIDGMWQGILKGLLDIPKTILRMLKGLATGLVDALGFKGLANKMKAFDLGKWWDRVIGGFIDKLDIFTGAHDIKTKLIDVFVNMAAAVAKHALGGGVAGQAAATAILKLGSNGGSNSNSQQDQDPGSSQDPSNPHDTESGQPQSGFAGNMANAAAVLMRNTPAGRLMSAGANVVNALRNTAGSAAGGNAAARGSVKYTGPVYAGNGKASQGPRNASRGIRNNNPGNIDYNRGTNWQGQIGREDGNGRFVKFDSQENGLRALGRTLLTYRNSHGIDTINGIVNRWAPASDNNDVASYVANMARQVGVRPDEKIDVTDPEVMAKVMRAIVNHENGSSASQVSDAMIQEGTRRALSGVARPSQSSGGSQSNGSRPTTGQTQTVTLQNAGSRPSQSSGPSSSTRPSGGNTSVTQVNNTNVIPPTRPAASSANNGSAGPRA